MSAWQITLFSLLAVPPGVAIMGALMFTVFDLLDLTRPRDERIHAWRSIIQALKGARR